MNRTPDELRATRKRRAKASRARTAKRLRTENIEHLHAAWRAEVQRQQTDPTGGKAG